MAVFIGKSKNSSAVRTALKTNYCVREIINPLINKQYSGNTFTLKHVVGIDVSPIRTARTGVRGNNDLFGLVARRTIDEEASLVRARRVSQLVWNKGIPASKARVGRLDALLR
jgi:hypothetical protein